MILQLHRESQKVGLKMKKTKVMFNSYILDHEILIHAVTDCVQNHIYLGQKIRACPDHEKEIKRRIGIGWSDFGKLNIMKSNIPLALKIKIYIIIAFLPVLTYGSET